MLILHLLDLVDSTLQTRAFGKVAKDEKHLPQNILQLAPLMDLSKQPSHTKTNTHVKFVVQV